MEEEEAETEERKAFLALVEQHRRQLGEEDFYAKPEIRKAVTVAYRVRPVLDHEKCLLGQLCVGSTSTSFNQLEYEAVFPQTRRVVILEEEREVGLSNGQLVRRVFTADLVFGPDSTDVEVYRDLVLPLVEHALGGSRSTVLCFGQTASGKTFTTWQQLRLVAERLFVQKEKESDLPKFRVRFFELRGNLAFDLLRSRHPLPIRTGADGNVTVSGAQMKEVSSRSEFEAVLAEGNALRATAHTLANSASSRSHAFCEIEVSKKCGDEDSPRKGLLRIVDLAGSERSVEAHSHSEERRREMRQINASLGTLKVRCA